MERKEKTEFILEQMRLLIAVAKMKDESASKDGKDSLADGDPEWTRVRVGSRKINEDFLKDPENKVRSLLVLWSNLSVERGLGIETPVLRYANPTRVALECLSGCGQILPQDLGNPFREGGREWKGPSGMLQVHGLLSRG